MTARPTFLDRAVAAIFPERGLRRMAARGVLHQFRYEGAEMSTARNSAPHNISPNSFDVQRDRLQLMREAEDLERNFAPAKHLNHKYALYTSPVSYHAQTGDHGLDQDVEDYLNTEVFPNVDVTGRYDFFRMMEFGIMGMNRGGDYGWVLLRPDLDDLDTEGMDPADIEAEAVRLPLKIQAVEPDRIGGIYQNVVSNDYVSGCVIGKYGKIDAFRVFHRSMTTSFYDSPVDIPADQFVHMTDPMRIDQYRGVSILATAVQNLRDLKEIIDFAKGKIKLASALTVFTNSNGAIGGAGAMDAYQTNLGFGNGSSGMQQDINYGQINHLSGGTDIKFPSSNTPSGEEMALMTLLLKFVAMSYNLPYSFALDAAALGGVSSRLESEMAKAEFERGRGVIAPHAHRIKNAFLIDAISKGIFPVNTLGVITKGRWGYRPHPQPDLGREASAAVNLFEHGLLNPLKHWIDESQDPEDTATDFARWAAIKQKAAASVGMDVQDVFGSGMAKPLSQSESSTDSAATDPTEKRFSRHEFKSNIPFDEDKHPRADDGKFGSGGKSTGRSERASVGNLVTATREGTGKESRITINGKPAPDFITPAMIPPAYSNNIRIATDRKSDVWAISEDEKGNTKRVYNPEFAKRNAAIKWTRANAGVQNIDSIRSQIHSDRNEGNSREEADVAWLMSQQATRPGSDEDTKGTKALWDSPVSSKNFTVTAQAKGPPKVTIKVGGSEIPIRDEGARAEIASRIEHGKPMGDAGYWLKSHGATTLEGRHVIKNPDGSASLQFMGKEGVWHDHKVTDPNLSKMLLQRKSTAGDKGRLFATDYQKTAKYVGTLGGGGFSPKDMRTIRANEAATKMIGSKPIEVSSDDERKKIIKDVATNVSRLLGNKPQQALESYINPMIFDMIKVRKTA